MRNITSSSSSITSAVSPAARPATRAWRHSVSKSVPVLTWALLMHYSVQTPADTVDLFTCSVGYSWMPLLKDGRMQSVELQLPVAATLPAGYLCQDTKKVQSCLYISLLNSHVYTDTIRLRSKRDLSEFDEGRIVSTGQGVSKTTAPAGCSWSVVVHQKWTKRIVVGS